MKEVRAARWGVAGLHRLQPPPAMAMAPPRRRCRAREQGGGEGGDPAGGGELARRGASARSGAAPPPPSLPRCRSKVRLLGLPPERAPLACLPRERAARRRVLPSTAPRRLDAAPSAQRPAPPLLLSHYAPISQPLGSRKEPGLRQRVKLEEAPSPALPHGRLPRRGRRPCAPPWLIRRIAPPRNRQPNTPTRKSTAAKIPASPSSIRPWIQPPVRPQYRCTDGGLCGQERAPLFLVLL